MSKNLRAKRSKIVQSNYRIVTTYFIMQLAIVLKQKFDFIFQPSSIQV